MIGNFAHKGVERLFRNGKPNGVPPAFRDKLLRLLDRLEASTEPADMDLPGFGLHELQGQRRGTYAVKVSGNWRLTFRFEGPRAVDVNLEDYH